VRHGEAYEVHIYGSGAYATILTLPRSTVRKVQGKVTLEAIPKLWKPLLRELNRAAQEWAESPRGMKHRKWCLDKGWSAE
jgi:hypothetical protein